MEQKQVSDSQINNRVEILEKEIERLEKLVYVPGLWKCAKCSCKLISNTIYVQSGNIGANNSPQRCPNDCGPMWRVTERDAGNELIDQMEKLKPLTKEKHHEQGI